MRSMLIAVALLFGVLIFGSTLAAQNGAAPAAAQPAAASAGDPAAGKAVWALGNTSCRNCHGADGEGGLAPMLAGRRIPYARFLNYVRNPIGRMPSSAGRTPAPMMAQSWSRPRLNRSSR